jgi:alanine racemase
LSLHSPIPIVEVSLDNLLHNVGQLRSRLPKDAGIIAVVKDNAYGCGSRMVALTLEREGNVRFFAVASPAEAFFLRESGVKSPILVFGAAASGDLQRGHQNDIIFTLNDFSDINRWQSAGVPVRFHCNIDTRMHRMGVMPAEIAAAADAVRRAPSLRLEGAFTHLANADESGTVTVAEQLRLFFDGIATFRQAGLDVAAIHCANSAGLIRFGMPAGCTLARPGIALYGCRADPSRDFPLDLRLVASVKSRVAKIKTVPPHTPVSYGGAYTTDRETRIATIALGYGHGYPRSLGNRGALLINGRRFPIIGRVTMDYCMVDAGNESVIKAGDEVVAIGCQGTECITADDIALLQGTIAYEILCNLSQSLDRVYLRENRIVAKEKGRIF